MGRLKNHALAAEDAARLTIALGDLTPYGADVSCRCHRCGHEAVLDLEMLLNRFGPAAEVPTLGAWLRCGGCGSKDIATRPCWPRRDRSPRPAPGDGV